MSAPIQSEVAVSTQENPTVIARAVALLAEQLIEQHEFIALTGISVANVPTILQSASMLAEVQRATLKLRTSGESTRLEATRHAREAVQIAANIMRDPEMLASNRLNAATFIARVSGTERPPVDAGRAAEKHTITINIGGDRAPIIVESNPTNIQTATSRETT